MLPVVNYHVQTQDSPSWCQKQRLDSAPLLPFPSFCLCSSRCKHEHSALLSPALCLWSQHATDHGAAASLGYSDSACAPLSCWAANSWHPGINNGMFCPASLKREQDRWVVWTVKKVTNLQGLTWLPLRFLLLGRQPIASHLDSVNTVLLGPEWRAVVLEALDTLCYVVAFVGLCPVRPK